MKHLLTIALIAGQLTTANAHTSSDLAIESLRAAQQKYLASDSVGMMKDLIEALNIWPRDRFITQQAVQFSSRYYGQKVRAEFMPAPPLVTGYFIGVKREQHNNGPTEYSFHFTQTLRNGTKPPKVEIITPNGQIEDLTNPSNLTEVFPSGFVGSTTFRAWGKPTREPFEPGLYKVRLTFLDQQYVRELLLSPDTVDSSLLKFRYDRANRKLTYQLPPSQTVVGKMERTIYFTTFRKSSNRARPLWEKQIVIRDNETRTGTLLIDPPEGQFAIFVSCFDETSLSPLDISYEQQISETIYSKPTRAPSNIENRTEESGPLWHPKWRPASN